MPIDLFEQEAQQQQKKKGQDLFAGKNFNIAKKNEEMPQKEPELSELIKNSLTKELAKGLSPISTGLEEGLYGLFNLPHQAAKALHPKLGEFISEVKPRNYMEESGITDPDMFQQFVKEGASYLPATALGGLGQATKLGQAVLKSAPSLTTTMRGLLEGGLHGGTTSEENKIQNAADEGITNALIAGVPGGIGKGLRAFKTAPEKLERFTNQLNDMFAGSRQNDLTKAFPAAEKTLAGIKKEANQVWGLAHELAEGVHYNNKELEEAIANRLHTLEKEGEKSSIAKNNNVPSINFLKEILNTDIPHLNTYEDAMQFRKNLNSIYKREVPKESRSKTKKELDFVSKNVRNDFAKRTDEDGLLELREATDKANALTKYEKKLFYEKDLATGKKGKSVTGRLLESTEHPTPEILVNEFVPRPGEIGTGRFQQLEEILGSKPLTQQMLKAKIYGHIFSPTKEEIAQGAKEPPRKIANQFINSYFDKGKISEAQNAYLFTPQERHTIVELKKFHDKYPEELNKNKLFKEWVSNIIGLRHKVGINKKGLAKVNKQLERPTTQYLTKSLAAELRKSNNNNKEAQE